MLAELLTRRGNCWCVDDRRHFLDVAEEKAVKEHLGGVLQSAQIGVPFQVVLFSLVSFISAHDLLLQVSTYGGSNPWRLNLVRCSSIKPVPLFSEGRVDQFVQAVKGELSGACLQWEDFGTAHARPS